MAEPPANWDQQDDDTTVSSTMSKLGRLNVNAMEFVPTFGSGPSFAPKAPTVPQSTVPKTPPSTPVITRNTTEDEKKQTEPVIIASEVNVQQQVKEPVITTGEREFDDLVGEDNESEFTFFLSYFLHEFEFYFLFRNN